MTINRFGRFSYKHQMDTSWDVSEWLLETRNQLTTWSDVYWYIWGTINYLECSRCLETFPCTEFSNCRYHPERAVFEPNHLTGEHPCCGLKVQRFDPLQPNKVSLSYVLLLLLLLLLPLRHTFFAKYWPDVLIASEIFWRCAIEIITLHLLTYLLESFVNFALSKYQSPL